MSLLDGMEKYFVTKEEAKALAGIGCKFDTPFYYNRTNNVMFDVKVYMGYDDAGHYVVVNGDFDDFQFTRLSEKEILAPTYAEALDWFRNKGEVFKVDVKLKGKEVEYTSFVMEQGEFIPAGKFSNYNEAEKCILNFYINVEIENKIYKLEKLKK